MKSLSRQTPVTEFFQSSSENTVSLREISVTGDDQGDPSTVQEKRLLLELLFVHHFIIFHK
jgi:hypothetical protein